MPSSYNPRRLSTAVLEKDYAGLFTLIQSVSKGVYSLIYISDEDWDSEAIQLFKLDSTYIGKLCDGSYTIYDLTQQRMIHLCTRNWYSKPNQIAQYRLSFTGKIIKSGSFYDNNNDEVPAKTLTELFALPTITRMGAYARIEPDYFVRQTTICLALGYLGTSFYLKLDHTRSPELLTNDSDCTEGHTLIQGITIPTSGLAVYDPFNKTYTVYECTVESDDYTYYAVPLKDRKPMLKSDLHKVYPDQYILTTRFKDENGTYLYIPHYVSNRAYKVPLKHYMALESSLKPGHKIYNCIPSTLWKDYSELYVVREDHHASIVPRMTLTKALGTQYKFEDRNRSKIKPDFSIPFNVGYEHNYNLSALYDISIMTAERCSDLGIDLTHATPMSIVTPSGLPLTGKRITIKQPSYRSFVLEELEFFIPDDSTWSYNILGLNFLTQFLIVIDNLTGVIWFTRKDDVK